MEKITDVLFYTMDKSIRSYRQFAQREIKKAGYSITIDQWLLLKNIQEEPSINQTELSEKVFKDNASVTRIIGMLVKSGMLKRNVNDNDRRRTSLTVTDQGKKTLNEVQSVISKNRSTALKGIRNEELEALKKNLLKIIDNVNNEKS